MRPIEKRALPVFGITGGVGAGKSTVLAYMEEAYGAFVLQADEAGHKVMEPGGSCYAPMVEHFGSGILDEAGQIDRARVAAIVFSDERELAWQTALIHPAVKAFIREQIAAAEAERTSPFILVEAALLLEDHYEELCEEFWYLYASEEVRRERLKAARGYTDERIDGILRSQQPEKVFRVSCQRVIDNSKTPAETFLQIDAILKEKEFEKIS